MRTLKEYLRTNLDEGLNINQALGRVLNVMRITVHSSVKETPFERHHGRKPRTEIQQHQRSCEFIHPPMEREHTINS